MASSLKKQNKKLPPKLNFVEVVTFEFFVRPIFGACPEITFPWVNEIGLRKALKLGPFIDQTIGFKWMEMVIPNHFSMRKIWFIIQLKQTF